MKARLLILVVMLGALTLSAQEQPGIVKTIGRPGQPGNPLDGVFVRAQGAMNASVSDDDGSFTIILDQHQVGQAYSLSRVSRTGYQLADGGLIGRAFPFSTEIPLEITMVSMDDYYRVKNEIEAKVRNVMEKEYQRQTSILRKRLEESEISEDLYRNKMIEILDYYDNSANLIDKLADRYARMDYDHLDSVDLRINALIEQGQLEEAETLIQSKGTKKALDELRRNNFLLEQTLSEGKTAELKMIEDYAAELLMRYDIASLRFDNEEAAGFLNERMRLDSTRVDWGIDYANFIRDYLGRYDEAMEIYMKSLNTVSDSPVKAEIYGCIGHLHQLQGHYDSAMEAFMTGVALKEAYSVGLQSLAVSYYNLASVHIEKDQYDDAIFYLQKAEKIYEEYDDSLGFAGILTARAFVYDDLGDFNEAEECLLKSLALRKKELGENDLQVASSYASLASLLRTLGRYEEATRYLNKSIEVNTKVLGDHHPKVAMSYLDLGSLLSELGNNEDVMRYYEFALRMLKEYHGDTHPNIALAYNRLGHYYKNVLNDFDKALHYYKESLEMYRSIYGDLHSDVAGAIHNLASLYYAFADYDKTLDLYNQALDIKTRMYGQMHYSVADTYNNLTQLYSELGRYEDALSYSEKVLDIYKAFYGDKHYLVGLAYNNMAAIYISLKEDQKALNYFAKSCEIYLAYGDSYYRLAVPYDQIGAIYLRYKMFDQAEKYLTEALRIREKVYGPNHSDVAESMNNLSQVYLAKEDYEMTEELLEKCLQIKIMHFGEKHPDTATVLANLADLYTRQKKYDKAEPLYLQALDIVEQCFTNGHPRIDLYRYGIANNYYRMGEDVKALPYLSPVYYNSMKNDGPDGRYTIHYFNFMHELYALIMGEENYDGMLDDDFQAFNENTVFRATVLEDSVASKMGLSGVYYVMEFEDWALWQNDVNFFVYAKSVSSKPNKTYVFCRDGEYWIIPFEGSLGVKVNPKWIPVEEKEQLIRAYKKWAKKNRRTR